MRNEISWAPHLRAQQPQDDDPLETITVRDNCEFSSLLSPSISLLTVILPQLRAVGLPAYTMDGFTRLRQCRPVLSLLLTCSQTHQKDKPTSRAPPCRLHPPPTNHENSSPELLRTVHRNLRQFRPCNTPNPSWRQYRAPSQLPIRLLFGSRSP